MNNGKDTYIYARKTGSLGKTGFSRLAAFLFFAHSHPPRATDRGPRQDESKISDALDQAVQALVEGRDPEFRVRQQKVRA